MLRDQQYNIVLDDKAGMMSNPVTQWRICYNKYGGSLYRSTGQNINGPNINELQINCSIGQQKLVDV